MVSISENAAKKLKTLKTESGHPENSFLRVEVKKSETAQLYYRLNFDSNLKEGDNKFSNHGEEIVVDAQSLPHIFGMILDFSGGLNGQGFLFKK